MALKLGQEQGFATTIHRTVHLLRGAVVIVTSHQNCDASIAPDDKWRLSVLCVDVYMCSFEKDLTRWSQEGSVHVGLTMI